MIVSTIVIISFFATREKSKAPLLPMQCGYTIIEAGKGLNCKGDTIVIEKIHGTILALNK